jgi:alcohol dehydrogenase (NADP+)
VVPKSVQQSPMEQNIRLERLPDDAYGVIDRLSEKRGHIRFLDPSRHLGFDIFDEKNDQPVADEAPWD